ncbi:ATPase [Actinomycetota bacterium]|nr:ATPase [Actinomycetota bacterium]
MQNVPFVFGRIAENENFIDRDNERKRLKQNFNAQVNTIIISPRRWGKSSLVKRVAKEVTTKDKKTKVCLIDLFNVRDEAGFYAQLAQSLIRATSSKGAEWLANAKEFLSHLRPKVVFSADMREEVSFDIEWEKVRQDPDTIIDLAETIAKAKDIKLIVCIDEFQSIGDFKDSLAVQRKLRSHWQNHQHVCYCLYGSKRHMLLELFADASMPFYRFGDIMMLGKIDNKVWADFIVKRFEQTDKQITIDLAGYLANHADNHSYYVQQLAQQVWLRTVQVCTQEIVDSAMEDLKDQLSLLFTSLTDTLSAKQLEFLRAYLNGITAYSSVKSLKQYKLGTSAGVTRVKAALQAKEIIDIDGGRIEMLDPLFKYWLAKDYFGDQ